MMSFLDTNLEQLTNLLKLDDSDLKPVLNKNWILAFSGGADSTLALNVLLVIHKLHPLKNRKLILYFLNHGDQNIYDALQRQNNLDAFVKRINHEFPDIRLEFKSYHRDMKGISKKLKGNFELISARIRRKHTEIIYKNNPDSVLVTGHNMSDWFETLLMRMNRGASIEKLYPFLPYESNLLINYFRPLVLLTSDEIRNICRFNSFNYWVDPSNFAGTNKRSKIRKITGIENAEGFRITTRNFFKSKMEWLVHQDTIRNRLYENIVTISNGREYHIERNYFTNLSPGEKRILFNSILQRLKLWPVSESLFESFSNIPFYFKLWSVEKENRANTIYIVFRRGRNKLEFDKKIEYDHSKYSFITGDKITKKNYIKMQYGRKEVKKIFSEKCLSNRQRSALPLICDKSNPYEILYIPLSIFGLKDIKSVNYT